MPIESHSRGLACYVAILLAAAATTPAESRELLPEKVARGAYPDLAEQASAGGSRHQKSQLAVLRMGLETGRPLNWKLATGN